MNWKKDWPSAYTKTQASGILKQQPEDFIVDEIPLFQATSLTGLDANADIGEHIYLYIKKRNANTLWVAKLIAQLCGVSEKDVGYAGLKDRHAVTTQWFSVYLPLRDLNGQEKVLPKFLSAKDIFADSRYDEYQQQLSDEQQSEQELIEVLQQTRHNKKLRPGDLLGNRFKLRLRNVEGEQTAIAKNLAQVKKFGVPNYFGDQRFGHDYANLDMAQAMFDGKRIRNKKKKGLYLSAARSYLFNLVLAERIEQGLWGKTIAGDINCQGEAATEAMHASAPLWGRGRLASSELALELEQSLIESLPEFNDGLEHSGLNQERRLITAEVANLQWQWQDSDLILDFSLPAGYYATSVLQEILQANEPERAADIAAKNAEQ